MENLKEKFSINFELPASLKEEFEREENLTMEDLLKKIRSVKIDTSKIKLKISETGE